MKPVILGMNNPLSDDPRHALYPAPVNCTGWRLWRMLNARTGANRSQYLEAFDRLNILHARSWNTSQAREAAEAIIILLQGRTVVVLGAQPVAALRLPVLLVKPQEVHGVTWRQVPHPSGRNPWYNVPENRAMVELLLEELYMKEKSRCT